MSNLDAYIFNNLIGVSPIVADLINQENKRQDENIELIASENYPSDAVKLAQASCLVAKYSEGYPTERISGREGRYYGGCENVDRIEEYCCQKWREVFNTDYHVNVQPHSGSQANYAALAAVLQPGDTVLSMSLDNGAHLTHGSPVNFSGKLYNMKFYEVDENGFIDYEDLKSKIYKYRPRLILAGASAYSREIKFDKIKEAINEIKIKIAYENVASQNFDTDGDAVTPGFEDYNPYFMVDMAHIAGLVAAGYHQSPFGLADIITTTTHKTLKGPRGGLIFSRPELAKKIDGAVFPGSQGGPLQHIIAAKAICAEEDCKGDFRRYIGQVVKNAEAMCNEFIRLGYKVVTGGTDNHLFLIDLRQNFPNLSGKQVQDYLDTHHITLNKNCVPAETRSPMQASGIRIGTPAMTTKGWVEEDFIECARTIDKLIKELNENDK